MKQLFSLLLLILFVSTGLFAQVDLLSKIPKDASVVGVFKGQKFLEHISLEQLKQYHFVNDLFGGAQKIDNFDVTANAYYFMSLTDSISYNCVLLPLKSETGFRKMMKNRKIEKYGAFSGFIDDELIFWDDKSVLLVLPFGLDEPKVYSYNYEEDEGYEARMKSHRKKTKKLLEAFAIKTLSNSNKAHSIATNSEYLKSKNKKAVMSIWLNNYGEAYSKLLGLNRMPGMSELLVGLSRPGATGVEEITANMFLEKDQAKIVIETEMNEKMSDYYKAVGKRKFNKKFFKYFDEEKVMGYMGLAIDVENAIDEYPKLIEGLFANIMPSMKEEASVGADLFSILVDGEAVGELISGDAMFVVTDVVEKELKYTAYEYDEDFNSMKVEKTKMESMPEFIFMLSTEREDFFNKVFRLAHKYEWTTSETKNVYTLKYEDFPMEVYAVLHDGILFMTSSEYQAREIAAGKTLSTSRKHRRFTRKQSTVFYANNDAIVNAINNATSKGPLRNDIMGAMNYYANFKTANIRVSRIKGNTVTTTMEVKTTGENENALKTFFGLFDEVL